MIKFLLYLERNWRKISALLAEGSWKNFILPSNLLKLAFLYMITIFYILLFEFNFSKNFLTLKATSTNYHRVAIYSAPFRIGESLAYDRTLRALDNLGWDYTGAKLSESLTTYFLTKHFYYVASAIAHYWLKPEINIALTHHVYLLPPGDNFIYLNIPDHNLYNVAGQFQQQYTHLNDYDGYIDLHSVAHPSHEMLAQALKYAKNPDAPVIAAYLAQNYIDYQAAPHFEQLVITGSLWGCNRESLRIRLALKQLAEKNKLIAYGIKAYMKFLGNAYKGDVDEYGPPIDSLIELQRAQGIALVLHNLEHMLGAIPTSRILESIASGSVVISDNHPFIKLYFGNNVLYIDTLTSSEQIVAQIEQHLEWIKNHPKQVKAMTKRAYEIFAENWTIEKQLVKIFEQLTQLRTSHAPIN